MLQNLETTAEEARAFLNKLAQQLGHPEEKGRSAILLRAALHALRDHLSIQQSFHLMAQLPSYLKLVYVDNWKYRDKPVASDSQEAFTAYIKKLQDTYGEYQFNWPEHTGDLVRVIYNLISQMVEEGGIRKVINELPEDIQVFFNSQEAMPTKTGGNIRYDTDAAQEDAVSVAEIASGNIRIGSGVQDTNEDAGESAAGGTDEDRPGTA